MIEIVWRESSERIGLQYTIRDGSSREWHLDVTEEVGRLAGQE